MQNKEKIFMNGIFVREKTFENGGSILNVDIINVDEFSKQLQQYKNKDSKVTLEIKSRRVKAENGLTHYVEVSQFNMNKETNSKPSSPNISTNNNNHDDMPF